MYVVGVVKRPTWWRTFAIWCRWSIWAACMHGEEQCYCGIGFAFSGKRWGYSWVGRENKGATTNSFNTPVKNITMETQGIELWMAINWFLWLHLNSVYTRLFILFIAIRLTCPHIRSREQSRSLCMGLSSLGRVDPAIVRCSAQGQLLKVDQHSCPLPAGSTYIKISVNCTSAVQSIG